MTKPKNKISDKQIEKLALALKEKFFTEKRNSQYARVKPILTLLATGAFLSLAMIMPNFPKITKSFLKEHQDDWEDWKQYNLYYLRRTIERLRKQKLVQIKEKGGQQIVEITQKGRKKILKYALDELEIKRPKTWDRKWRLIIYDIPERKKHLRNIFRNHLKALGFLGLQDSVFLYPFPCEDEVEFLRQLYGLEKYIIILVIKELENEKPYREYFGI